MSVSDDRTFFVSKESLPEFRNAIARYVKLLISARWRCEPGFMKPAELARWKLRNIHEELRTPEMLLRKAAKELGYINRELFDRCGSGGVLAADEADPSGRLYHVVAFLVPPEGGGPEHNLELRVAADDLKAGKTVDWNSLVGWDQLPSIRADLDLLFGQDPVAGLNRFSWRAPYWTIRFQGKDLPPLKEYGFFLIKMLLLNPDRQFSITCLDHALTAWRADPSIQLCLISIQAELNVVVLSVRRV